MSNNTITVGSLALSSADAIGVVAIEGVAWKVTLGMLMLGCYWLAWQALAADLSEEGGAK